MVIFPPLLGTNERKKFMAGVCLVWGLMIKAGD